MPVPSAAAAGATVVGDASKALSLPGLRVGWIVERDPVLRARYLRGRMNFTISNSLLTEFLAAIAVRHGEPILRRGEIVTRHNLDLLRPFMERWTEELGWVEPLGGTLCFPWLRSGVSARPLCEALLAVGVLIVPGDAFGQPEHIRLGLAAEDDIGAALETAEAVLSSWFAARPRAGRVRRGA